MAIVTFNDKQTERIWNGEFSKKLPREIHKRVWAKLSVLDAATELRDLRIPSSNRLEALKGNRKGQHSIRVNDQFRICFEWNGGKVTGVEVTDYH
jgi:proteic killer suppression protein